MRIGYKFFCRIDANLRRLDRANQGRRKGNSRKAAEA